MKGKLRTENLVGSTRLKECLRYDLHTGEFTWNKDTGRAKAETVAGYKTAYGYILISVDGSRYFAHRLVWLYVHGVWPPEHMDHINRDRSDNRLVNLRLCSKKENGQNVGRKSNSTTGIVGTSPGRFGKYRARIQVDGKQIHLGSFLDMEEAVKAYAEAKKVLHTFHSEATCPIHNGL